MIEALRTPEDRFSNLPDFPYAPRFVDDLPGYEGLRAAVIDEGPRTAGTTFLCLHGEPSWSFLYRKMIPVFTGAGARVVAPDLLGFGRSDKPLDDAVYTFTFHRDFLLRLVERLDLGNVVLVVQDWGGLLGLTLPLDAGFRTRLKGALIMNTTIATGQPAGPGFDAWRAFAAAHPDLDVQGLMQRATAHLTPQEAAAYAAPFPDVRYKAGVRAFPQIVMTAPDMDGASLSKAAEQFWSQTWDGPSFMAYGAGDIVFPPAHMEALREKIRGCPPAFVVPEGGHFVQEWGGPIALAALPTFGLHGPGE